MTNSMKSNTANSSINPSESEPIVHENLLRMAYSFAEWYDANFRSICRKHLKLIPTKIERIWDSITILQDHLKGREAVQVGNESHMIEDANSAFMDADDKSLMKRILAFQREMIARSVFERLNKTTDPDTRSLIESELAEIDKIHNSETFSGVNEMELPAISEFLNTSAISELIWFDNEWRDLDEKFGLMLNSSSVYPMLDEIKSKCAFTAAPLSVAFFDIDDFKAINTTYSEQTVDREILPKFMSHMVSKFFWHSYLFRLGGDEYFLIIPHIAPSIAAEMVREYQATLNEITFGSKNTKISVSVGMVHLNGRTSKVAHEIIQFANDEKQKAKQHKGSISEVTIMN